MNTRRISHIFAIVVMVTLAATTLIATLSAIHSSEANQFTYLPIVQKPWPPPEILTFTANVPIADPGDTIELQWDTSNATTVTLYHMFPPGQLGTFWAVSPTGTMPYTIPESTRNQENFALYAGNPGNPYTNATLYLPLTCPFTWFFQPAPDICPQDAVLVSPGAEQAFEHGWMIWVGEEDRIYVLYNDETFSPKWQAFQDEWNEGDPIDDPSITPPPGFYQPVRGFGLVWREQPNVRDRLGWALAPEAAYTTQVQRTSYYKYNHTYIRAYDGNVWHLEPEHSGWEKIMTP